MFLLIAGEKKDLQVIEIVSAEFGLAPIFPSTFSFQQFKHYVIFIGWSERRESERKYDFGRGDPSFIAVLQG